jgi:hypothetical protein
LLIINLKGTTLITHFKEYIIIYFKEYIINLDKINHLKENVGTIICERYIKLKTLIQYKLNCGLIQWEVNERIGTSRIYGIFDMNVNPNSTIFVFRALYRYNVFIGIVINKIIFDHIKYLYNNLDNISKNLILSKWL